MTEPKLITLDIETSARVGLFFGSTYKPNIAKVVQEMYVFGFSWKPLGKKVQSCYIWDFKRYKKEPRNDIEVIKKWVEVVSEADVVIGQNSRSFDDKIMLGRAIVHNIPPPTPFASIDTMSDLKRVARYDSNKLNDVSREYGFGGKADTGGIDLWWACMCGDKKAQKKMVNYCEKDVMLTEKKYLRERPYYKRHPSISLMAGKPDNCPKCGEGPLAVAKKRKYANTGYAIQYQCTACGGYCTRRKRESSDVHFVN